MGIGKRPGLLDPARALTECSLTVSPRSPAQPERPDLRPAFTRRLHRAIRADRRDRGRLPAGAVVSPFPPPNPHPRPGGASPPPTPPATGELGYAPGSPPSPPGRPG